MLNISSTILQPRHLLLASSHALDLDQTVWLEGLFLCTLLIVCFFYSVYCSWWGWEPGGILWPSIPELSVTLQWDIPRENKEDEITVYDIHFRPNDGDGYSNETSVSGACKIITLTSASGIVPQTTYEFGVGARTRDAVGIGKQLLVRHKLSYYTLVCI